MISDLRVQTLSLPRNIPFDSLLCHPMKQNTQKQRKAALLNSENNAWQEQMKLQCFRAWEKVHPLFLQIPFQT